MKKILLIVSLCMLMMAFVVPAAFAGPVSNYLGASIVATGGGTPGDAIALTWATSEPTSATVGTDFNMSIKADLNTGGTTGDVTYIVKVTDGLGATVGYDTFAITTTDTGTTVNYVIDQWIIDTSADVFPTAGETVALSGNINTVGTYNVTINAVQP